MHSNTASPLLISFISNKRDHKSSSLSQAELIAFCFHPNNNLNKRTKQTKIQVRFVLQEMQRWIMNPYKFLQAQAKNGRWLFLWTISSHVLQSTYLFLTWHKKIAAVFIFNASMIALHLPSSHDAKYEVAALR